MKKKPTLATAIKAINDHGILLTYPIDNRDEPLSLWSSFYPGDEMVWEWNEDSDDRVGNLWRMRTELSTTKEVIYAKWFRGRATFFSKEIFTALLSFSSSAEISPRQLSSEAQQIIEVLEMDSPQSTKQIKLSTELRGKTFAAIYERAMKELWNRFLIVGFGEVEDGAFPSLAVGLTQLLFEELWEASRKISPDKALEILKNKLGADSLFFKQILKNK